MAEGKGYTELPWCASEAYPFMIEKEVIGLADGHDSYVIAEVKKHSLISSNEALANRNLIITAVNTYPAVEGLVKALEFYSQLVRYEGPNQRPIENDPYAKPDDAYRRDVTRDGGEIARSALSRFRSLQNGGAN